MKILCVDEDKKTVEQIANQLTGHGYTVHSAHDTLGAIEELEKHLDFNLMICDFRLKPGTAEPIFWHLSVNNYSLSSIIYCAENDSYVKSQINYPDLITVVKKPDLLRLCECVKNFAEFLKQATTPGNGPT